MTIDAFILTFFWAFGLILWYFYIFSERKIFSLYPQPKRLLMWFLAIFVVPVLIPIIYLVIVFAGIFLFGTVILNTIRGRD